ncbi:MAG TPA: Glu/Leu/Phe/Val dehydrogenase dimerization domain-containing protein [candidate division Zixibacteria bacterium]|nr:Glu/Leu/Phe/Val dehydrogenase dimerization domain-containing protein [candidate division Zixibacteria bacterium]
MEELLRNWDGENLIVTYDRPAKTWIIIAVHSTVLGPAVGGTRMKTYTDLGEAVLDAQRLAAGMTYKWAAAGSDMGGGKAVLFVSEEMTGDDRTALLERYGDLVQKLRGLFMTGPDLGTSVADMDVIGQRAPSYIFGRSTAFGGAGDPAPFTALGVFTAIEVTAKQLFSETSVREKRVVIQGAGSVGRNLARMLSEAGAEVLFTDVDESAVQYGRDELGLTFIPTDEVYDVQCDIFAPCAIGGIISASTIDRLNCRAVVGGANNQLVKPEDAANLRARGILYAPDFVANCGGAVAITGIETTGWTREQAAEKVRKSVRENLLKIYELSSSQDISTDQAACLLAEMRLAKSEH